MKKETDSRINVSQVPIKEYGFLFFIVAISIPLLWLIYQALVKSRLMYSNPVLSIIIQLVCILGVSALEAASIFLFRERISIRPIKKIAEATRNIVNGDLSVRIAPLRKDEKKISLR